MLKELEWESSIKNICPSTKKTQIFGVDSYFLPPKPDSQFQELKVPGFDDPFVYAQETSTRLLARFYIGTLKDLPNVLQFGIICIREDTGKFQFSTIFGNISCENPFLSKDQKKFKPFLEALVKNDKLPGKSFLFAAAIIGHTKEVSSTKPLSEREISILVDFISSHYYNHFIPLKSDGITHFGITKIANSFGSIGEDILGYLPMAWSLKDLASWLLVCGRLPTMEEAKKFQKESILSARTVERELS